MKTIKIIARLKKLHLATFFSALMLIVSCGESVDPSMADIKLQMKATTQLSSINTNARVAETDITFTEVMIGVTEIEFESLEQDDDDDDKNDNSGNDDSNDDSDGDDDDGDDRYDIEFEGQFVVDLLKGTSNPDFGIADVIPGNYEEIEIEISPILDDGNSIFIKLNYTQEGMDPIMVEISTYKEFDLEIENDSGIQLEGNSLNQVLVLFDLDKLLSGIDLEMADTDGDGMVRINENSNSNILSKLWSNIDDAFDAGEDSDDDDEIDDDDVDD